jgi:hypothetical protein
MSKSVKTSAKIVKIVQNTTSSTIVVDGKTIPPNGVVNFYEGE